MASSANRRAHFSFQCPARRAQQGMAVIGVLLVVAIIAVLAAAMMGRQTVAIRGVQSELTRLQAGWLLRGELARAQLTLRAEAMRGPVTRLDGRWNRPVAGLTIGPVAGEPARLFSEIVDEQAKFNLRNLVDNGLPDPIEIDAFLRLCALLGVPEEQGMLMARRVVVSLVAAERRTDAAPPESEAARAAAERLGLADIPQRELAPRLRVVEDLLAVPHVAAESVARLQPYVTVLPRRTWINGNTASAELIAAWVPGLPLERARALLQTRDGGQWFINRGDFVNRLQMPELVANTVHIGITSQWFRVSAALRLPHTLVMMQALLHDDKETLPRVIWFREGV
ncbi:type II secretion system minor pseudopilin GspK [Brenneria izadpanahii]|uniref:Type II secretion system protein K n=1 Tax=Brenneria izadpanahii TaxID=2722756 RepID=A0ABX7UX37_9GAMM|nr:type II secretion system minor pseudopilin GspK [Brenneria izadpanahii]QTF08720.1 type II secretion system minor pseudopilin GspK [Brenneria izadpanahii]